MKGEGSKEGSLPLFSFCLWFGVRRRGNALMQVMQQQQQQLGAGNAAGVGAATPPGIETGHTDTVHGRWQMRVLYSSPSHVARLYIHMREKKRERERERETYSRALSSSAMYVLCSALRNGMITRERRRSMRQSSVLYMCNTGGHASLSLSLQ